MAPTVHDAKITLSCPLFSADFDPRNNGRLLVGGGGGEGRHGVGNKIYLLDTSNRDKVTEAVELSLSRDEDSVTSLVAAPQTDDDENALVVLAGINSSAAEQKKNNNQHLRSFQFEAPKKNKADTKVGGQGEVVPGKATALSQASIFRSKDGAGSADTYQRVLRLSPWRKQDSEKSSKHTRVGAIATGLAPSGEVVFFDATKSYSCSDSKVIGRIRLGDNEEAEDVDLVSLETKGQFRIAYTTGLDVVVGEISSSTRSSAAPDIKTVYKVPLPSNGARLPRPKFRALRFISPTVILLLQNAPNRSGSELVLLQLPMDQETEGQILCRCKLPRSVKIGLGLDICPLGTNEQGQQQTIIAASGSDHSISLWTVDSGPDSRFGKIRPYTTLRDVHPFSMTRLCFSTFTPPAHPITPEVLPQKVKLASVSMGNTVVVHTLPLSPFPASSLTARYTLRTPGPSETQQLIYYLLALLLAFLAILLAILAFADNRSARLY